MSFKHVRGMAVLAVSGVLSLTGVIASAAAPAEAGVSVSLSTNAAFLLTGQTVTLTATAATGMAGTTPANWLEIFDATTGTLLCTSPTGSTCTATETETVATTHDFVAYLAAFDYRDIFPPLNVTATSTPVPVTWVPLHHIPAV